MSKKLLINGDFYCRNLTGIERFASEICKNLDKMIEKNSISILIPSNAKIVPDFKNFNVIIATKSISSFFYWQQFILPKYLKKENAECLNFSNTCPIFRPGYVFLHDIYCKLYPKDFNSFRDKLIRIYSCFMYFHIAKNAKKIFTVSNFSKKQILETYKIKSHKIEVIPNGWDHFNEITSDFNIFQKYIELTKGNFYFTLGSLSKRKNLKWIAEYASNHKESHFAISGKIINGLVPKELEILKKLSNVTLLGYVSDEEVKALMQNCKAFIFPSYYEGFGIPPLEALSVGAKIIVSNAACLPEIYKDSAYYINPDDTNIDLDELLKQEVASPAEILNYYTYENAAKIFYNAIINLK